MSRIPSIFAVAGCLLCVGAAAHANSLIGDTIESVYLYPDTSTTYGDLGPIVVNGSTPTYGNINAANVLDIDITGSQIIFAYYGSGYSFSGTFDGVEFTDQTHPFTGATLDPASNTPGTLANAVTLVNGSIFVDLNGETYGPGENVIVDVNGATAVPEPVTWSLMLLGVGGVGAMSRRNRTSAIRTA